MSTQLQTPAGCGVNRKKIGLRSLTKKHLGLWACGLFARSGCARYELKPQTEQLKLRRPWKRMEAIVVPQVQQCHVAASLLRRGVVPALLPAATAGRLGISQIHHDLLHQSSSCVRDTSSVRTRAKPKKMNFFLEDDTEEDEAMADIVDMGEWMRNRPSGFGLGKDYDVSLEEKLLAEIEADRKAREAAKKGLGNVAKAKKPATKGTEAPPGVEVWVGNLPRKRKVDRDLNSVFKSAPGLLHIRPILDPDNEKTRDPICKGFAFLTFATDDDADNFVSKFHGQKVKFGKVEKKVACEVAVSDSPWRPKAATSGTSASTVPKLRVRDNSSTDDLGLVSPSMKKLGSDRGEYEKLVGSSAQSVPIYKTEREENSDEKDNEESEAGKAELQALEEEIWQEFEDDDDLALDVELEDEEHTEPILSQSIQDCEEDIEVGPSNSGVLVGDDEDVDDEKSLLDIDHTLEQVTKLEKIPVANDPPLRNTGTLNRVETRAVSGKEKTSTKIGENAEEKIKELEAKVREMEGRLQQVAQSEEERIEILERRLLMKAKVAAGTPATNAKTGNGVSGTKKEKKPTKKSKSGKPDINKLGSASRLKAKERQILTGVLQKYVSGPIQ